MELLPLWLAPNLVTLLGFFFILGNIVLLELYIPDLVGPAPSWVYYSFAFGMWMYGVSCYALPHACTDQRPQQVLHHGQCRWQASPSHGNFESTGRAIRVGSVVYHANNMS